MYKPAIKVCDCSIRDGGLMNNHQFSYDVVGKVYKAISKAGIDYIELGYKNSRKMFSPDEYGPWKFCDDEDILRVTEGIDSHTKISVMADVGRVDMDTFKPADESPVDMIRTAVYVKDVDAAIHMANEFHDKGYETTINLMAISRDQGWELDGALHQLENECKAEAVYIVDSFGSLYQESVEYIVEKFASAIKTKKIGFHGHNNQQLAFSNTVTSIINGVRFVDGTLYGIGRAAGNCPLELLIGFLKNPKFNLRAIMDIIAEEFVPIQQDLKWGYMLPYAVTGMTNNHPRAAMRFLNGENQNSYSTFYDEIYAKTD
ncbi:MAG: nucleoid-structuring protein H-NS [Proteobacteria bacterium]|nr:nucleoid-structuring protein H-NS [Pseudomonadota bacterium]